MVNLVTVAVGIVGLYFLSQTWLNDHLNNSESEDFQELADRESSEVPKSLKISRQSLIEAVMRIYTLEYSNDIMLFYSPEAVFTNPLITMQGRRQIATAHKSLGSIMKNPDIKPKRIAHGREFVAIDMVAKYKIQWVGYYVERPIFLKLKLEVKDEEEVIAAHYDQWYGKYLLGIEGPSYLGLAYVPRVVRFIHGILVSVFFSVPPGLLEK